MELRASAATVKAGTTIAGRVSRTARTTAPRDTALQPVNGCYGLDAGGVAGADTAGALPKVGVLRYCAGTAHSVAA